MIKYLTFRSITHINKITHRTQQQKPIKGVKLKIKMF